MCNLTTQEIENITAEKRLREIEKDINKRMKIYTHSAQPTEDEVTICWLIYEVNRLNELLHIEHSKGDSKEIQMSDPNKRYTVSIIRGSKDEDRAAPYRNVRKVEVQGSWLVITKNDRSTIYMSSMTVETVRVDEM